MKRLTQEDEAGILRYFVNGVEIEIPTPRAAGNMIAARANQLTRSGQARSALEAVDIARTEAPGLAAIFDSGVQAAGR